MEGSVTLVTAKNQHRCWKARTRVRKTRMCVDLYVLGEGAISEKGRMINSHQVYPIWKLIMQCFCLFQKAKQGVLKENSADFGGFFTLCPCFDPYVIEGNGKEQQQIGELTKRKAKENRETLCRKTQWKKTMQKDTAQKETECAKRI